MSINRVDPYGNYHDHASPNLTDGCESCDALKKRNSERGIPTKSISIHGGFTDGHPDRPPAPTERQRRCVAVALEGLHKAIVELGEAFGPSANEAQRDTVTALEAIRDGLKLAVKPGAVWPQ